MLHLAIPANNHVSMMGITRRRNPVRPYDRHSRTILAGIQQTRPEYLLRRSDTFLNYFKFFIIATMACLIFCNCSGHEEQKLEHNTRENTSHPSAIKGTSAGRETSASPAGRELKDGEIGTSWSDLKFEVRLEPEAPVTGDPLTAKVKFSNDLENNVKLNYVWLINGEKVQESGDPTLTQAIKCDDFVELKVSPFGESSPDGIRMCSTFVGNAPPELRLVSQNLDETGLYQAKIEASDPEKDSINLLLTKSPAGMLIDQQAQTVKWTLAPGQQGTFDVALSAKDGRGAETLLTYRIKVAWQEGERNKDHETSSAKIK